MYQSMFFWFKKGCYVDTEEYAEICSPPESEGADQIVETTQPKPSTLKETETTSPTFSPGSFSWFLGGKGQYVASEDFEEISLSESESGVQVNETSDSLSSNLDTITKNQPIVQSLSTLSSDINSIVSLENEYSPLGVIIEAEGTGIEATNSHTATDVTTDPPTDVNTDPPTVVNTDPTSVTTDLSVTESALPRFSTFVEVSPDGGKFPLPHIDGGIEVPKGALPESCTLEMGEHYLNPDILPCGIVPVAFALWLHVREGHPLNSPITVTQSHYVDTTTLKDGSLLKLAVLKVIKNARGEYECKKVDTTVKVDGKWATFTLPDLCYTVMYREVKPEERLGLKYCICPIFPSRERMMNYDQGSFYLYFCLMYDDPTLLTIVKTQCQDKDIPELRNHSIEYQKIVYFTSSKPLTWEDLEFQCSPTHSDSGWTLSKRYPQCKMKLYPLNNDIKNLEFWSQNFMFPPSYKLEVFWRDPTALKNDMITVTFLSPAKVIDSFEIACPLHVALPYSLSSRPAKVSDSKEYQIFRHHFVKIVDNIHFNVEEFCERLFSYSLIDEKTVEKVCDGDGTKRSKTRHIINTVSLCIKENRSTFWKFLKALAEDSPQYQSGGECLVSLYNVLYCAYRPNILIRAITIHSKILVTALMSTTSKNAERFLSKIGIKEISKDTGSLISDIIKELKRSDDPYQVFLDICPLQKENVHLQDFTDTVNADLARSRANPELSSYAVV